MIGLDARATCSDSLVGVQHDADKRTHSVGADVLLEVNSSGTVLTVSGNNLAPAASVAGVVHVVLDLVDVGDALAEVPGGGGLVVAVLDVDEGLSFSLDLSASAEAHKLGTLVQSDGRTDVLGFNSFGLIFHLCSQIGINQ